MENDRVILEKIEIILNNLILNKALSSKIREFFLSYLEPHRDFHTFKSRDEYIKYQKKTKITLRSYLTLDNEYVKSLEELEIANTLYEQGINYIYEDDYKIKTADIHHRQYKPDFFFRFDIYIEHFGIDRNMQTAPSVDNPKYIADMNWKIQIHEKYKTKLIQTFSYEKNENQLRTSLINKLKGFGVRCKPIDQRSF